MIHINQFLKEKIRQENLILLNVVWGLQANQYFNCILPSINLVQIDCHYLIIIKLQLILEKKKTRYFIKMYFKNNSYTNLKPIGPQWLAYLEMDPPKPSKLFKSFIIG